jgi:FkbM family methyltransferase
MKALEVRHKPTSIYVPPGGKAAPSAHIMVDVGSNIGACTFWQASAGHSVVAFEPLAINRYYLIETVLGNPSFSNLITLFPYGAGTERASFIAYSEPGNVGNSVIGEDGGGQFKVAQKVRKKHARFTGEGREDTCLT